MKQLVILLLLHLSVSMVIAQPGLLAWKVIQFHGNSGAKNAYTNFCYFELGDSIRYDEFKYFSGEREKNTLDSSQLLSNVMRLSVRSDYAPPTKELIALHFLDNEKEDVYVYLYLKRGEETVFEFGVGDTIYIEQLDLEKGTYLIDWASPYKKHFHENIEKQIATEKQKLQKKIETINLIKTHGDYKKLRAKQEQINQLKMKFLEQDKKFCGYYYTSVTDRLLNYGYNLPDVEKYAVKLTIPESTVKKQKVSSRPIPPEELTALVNNSKKRTEEQQAILRLIER